ncbi:MAG TPA: helix-turn-helix domain-containing protein [Dongiaceae bacterium]|jgi:CRP/FNR family nitrogen fixation transcriptional regulator|nr:helix-turn-helix domain-containing protein [Dongiaceae bacterium]
MSALLRSSISPASHASSRAVLAVIEGSRGRSEEGDLAALQAIGATVRVAKNASLFQEGEPSQHVYKVISGAIRTCRMLMDGRRQIADFFLPGDFFGLDWQATHGFTAEALADTVVISYPRRQLEALAERTPAIQRLLMSMLCKGLAATQEHVVMLGRQTAHERLAWFLLRVKERSGGGSEIDVPMSRMDIADYLGLTIETVSRGVSEFKRRHYISAVSAHQFRLTGLAALQALANGEVEA